MTDKQEEAIKELEKAFKRCSKLGLSFVGVDNDLLCMNRRGMNKYNRAISSGEITDKGYCPEMNAIEYDWQTKGNNCSTIFAETYIDSGGW